MQITNNWIDIESNDINRKQVSRYIGYGADYKLPARTSSLIDEYIENVYHLIDPAYSYVIMDVERVEGSIAVIEDSIILESRVIARLLEQCEKVAVFLLTIGKHLEDTTCRMAEDGLMVQATVLDAIGSDATERIADFVEGRISDAANAHGLVTSRRFSPGYCDWDIGQQEAVFQAVDSDAVGVSLTERCLMLPQKSMSGIIGIGPSDGNVDNYNPCKTCNKHDCLGRR